MNIYQPKMPVRPVDNGDDLDRLLRDYFQAEMPHPWPALKLPAKQASSRWIRARSRLALAASVALLLLGCWWLSGTSADYTRPMADLPTGMGTASPGHQPIVDKVKDREDKKARNPMPMPMIP